MLEMGMRDPRTLERKNEEEGKALKLKGNIKKKWTDEGVIGSTGTFLGVN